MRTHSLHLMARAAALTALLAGATLSHAATQGPADDSFYTLPANPPSGKNGDLVSYRDAKVNLGANATAVKAWNVLYQSKDSLDEANTVSGTVIVPTAAWSGAGSRPVILYAVGTHGLAQGCAPSRQLAAGTDYETANINAALKAGYAVLVTDYAGYLQGDAVTYLAGASQGHAVLDLFKAAQGIPNVGLDAKTKVGIWGYSQGGQSAAWAAEQLSSYAPEINVVGVAAGGIPADFIKSAYNLDGRNGAAFLASGVAGLNTEYPDTVNIDLIASEAGFAALDKLKTQCVFEALF
ncbi:MAG: hypothetical protein RI907_1320, partial [Pseudomonadota bacterium]